MPSIENNCKVSPTHLPPPTSPKTDEAKPNKMKQSQLKHRFQFRLDTKGTQIHNNSNVDKKCKNSDLFYDRITSN